MSARPEVQGNDAASMTDVERLVEFWHNDDQGIPLDDAAAEVLASLTSVVLRADAEKLATALEHIAKTWAYGNGAGPYAAKALADSGWRAAHPPEETTDGQ